MSPGFSLRITLSNAIKQSSVQTPAANRTRNPIISLWRAVSTYSTFSLDKNTTKKVPAENIIATIKPAKDSSRKLRLVLSWHPLTHVPSMEKLFSLLEKALGPSQARLEFRWMMQAIRSAHPGDCNIPPPPHAQDRPYDLPSLVKRRVSGEPLQYILGSQPFGVLNLLTRPPVLIPRPETEDWTMHLAEYIRPTPQKPVKLLDLCTGSGCIPLLLSRLWPAGSVRAFGVDISTDAVQLARDNATLCDVRVPSGTDLPTSSVRAAQNTFLPLLGNMRDPTFLLTHRLCPPFDVITSNPPYIPKREYDNLPTSVREYEDVRALLGDPDQESQEEGRGLTFYHAIAALVARAGVLTDTGLLVVEVGHGQAAEVERILREEGGLQSTKIWKDPWQIDRVVVASKRS